MPKVFYVQPDGVEKVVEGVVGDSVMQTAVRNGVAGIVGQCGGVLSCATCHVFLAPDEMDNFPAPSADEDEMLDCAATDREDTSRLSCQLTLCDGVDAHVRIPDEQL
ncbi:MULTISPECIES: 2Fe-2S iron-sulfur cluster-binding protein [unclassified Rhodococcus (in: high G+C Gram-positive bacteria)]|uniref:2Fe-2S iron-sulfur cluster-binding protein n=1 Tax=unclassified Rhodococcus (in: high G+C Gram-positive bacteria) TaxID=192944 RepID=UPI000928913D|nr:2Fe-2S iron-sulfur cluster-binding protein [Rhodococcus sp. M8]OLL18721.1 ferredoxin [Rhodococcus sp. M8]QPG47407.1 2Fe-2S iron-sulfur cluster binding domain-containing protein [Rhodococcus sp. M8]